MPSWTSVGTLLLLSTIGALSQNLPQCQTSCQQSSLASTGCSAASAPCVCDGPYQQSMLGCLVKPVSSGGCTFTEIIGWMQSIQAQCFMSPPIVPPCLTICPLQAESAANCSSGADLACTCSPTYTRAASACIQENCAEQYDDWNSGHQDSCNQQSTVITPSATPSPSGGSTITGPGPSTNGTSNTQTGSSGTVTGTSATSTSNSSGRSNKLEYSVFDLAKVTVGLAWACIVVGMV